MTDKRAERAIATREANRLKVWNFFHLNPFSTQIECAEGIGLSAIVVGRHVKAIKDGWKPSDSEGETDG